MDGDDFDAWDSQPSATSPAARAGLDLNSQASAADGFSGLGLYEAFIQGDDEELLPSHGMGIRLPPYRPPRAKAGDAMAEWSATTREFGVYDADENYNPMLPPPASTWPQDEPLVEDLNMNTFRDELAQALFNAV
ncbi:hypothetical protein GUJ93_ZPchr0006g41231 [Zizania palustris]|uniref:Uncharacterized protein n=1 Tax=Zizania palustris TaxID=103762 RepID=A0A8J5S7Q3_ZIZPA|nr:hypothetical protein GUJ93_ZPchr0006g41231 [Zizania palustris]